MSAHLPPAIDMQLLARVLEGARKTRGQSLRQIAAQTGVSAPTVNRVALGKGCDLATYVALCQWLGVSLDTFVRAAS